MTRTTFDSVMSKYLRRAAKSGKRIFDAKGAVNADSVIVVTMSYF